MPSRGLLSAATGHAGAIRNSIGMLVFGIEHDSGGQRMNQWIRAAALVATLSATISSAAERPHVWSDGLRPPAPVVPPKSVQTQRPAPPAEPVAQFPVNLPPPAEGPPVEQGGSLDLMCFGGGSANKASVANAWGWNSYGAFGSATIVGQRSQGFDDQVSLHIQGAEGRVRMPRTMLPAIRGGEDGWFKLHDIEIKANEITASVGVNAFNNPKLRLDRYSGTISVSGKAGDYSGQCRRFDPQQTQRQF